MKTRLLTTLTAALIALSAWATKIDGINYSLDSSTKTAAVTDGVSYKGEIIIPASVTYEGTTYSVTGIGSEAFRGCTGLTSITIGNSVNSIGYSAFRGCSGLTSIDIPNSVTSIGGEAFYGCTGLTSITIPSSVTSIGFSAFIYCTGLTSITIPSSVTSIELQVFYGCTGLTSITIPESVTSIGHLAFGGCTGLTSITIPSSVTSIELQAFYKCTGLTSVTIPNSVTSIGKKAFQYCTGLTSINIPNSVTSIGSEAFSGCEGLTSVTINSNDVVSTDYSYYSNSDIFGSQVTTYILGDNVTSIGSNAFSGCTGLTSITIPSSVTSIGNAAFRDCTGLTSITIPSSVTSIGNYAFADCTGLTSITIPSSVTSIGNEAFRGCTGLTSISIPESVTSIGKGAFSDCTSLTSVTINSNDVLKSGHLGDRFGKQVPTYIIGDNVTTTGSSAFYECTGLTSVTIPNSVTSIGNYTFYGCTGLTSINIPESVTSIGNYAFDGCTGLTSISIPESVTSIGSSAFSGCTGLTSVSIPESVTSIGSSAFSGCTSLTSVSIPESVMSIGNEAFAGCTNLMNVAIYSNDIVSNLYSSSFNLSTIFGSQVSTYILGDNIEAIGSGAFLGCTGLTDIEIPNSVTSIEAYAFRGCTGLTDIVIPSSVTSIGSQAFFSCTGLKSITVKSSDPGTYHCSTTAFNDYSATLHVPSGSKEAYASTAPWSKFANIEEEPIQVGGFLYTIQGDEANCVGTSRVEGWYNSPVENIPERITFDGKEYTVTAVEGIGYGYGSIIVLPKTLKRIGSLSAYNKVIICLSPTPPEIESISVNRNCALYVPDEYLEAHRTGWVVDGKLFGYRGFDVEFYPNLLEFYIRPMSHLLNYVYDDETMTATVSGFRLQHVSGPVISEALGCTSSRMSSNYRERIWAEQNDINLDWVVPATITKFQYLGVSTQSRVKTGETYAVKRVEKLLGARSVTLSEGIEEVGPEAFALTLWPMVTDAEGNAQYYNDPLESVSLPSTLKLLDWSAFQGCTSLKHVEMKEGLDSIGLSVFTYCLSLEDCHLPASLRAMGYGHGNLYSLQAFSTAQGSENIVAKDGVLFSDGGKTLLQYPAGKPDTTYEVPEGTVKLSQWSFEAVQTLESLVLPTSVEEIGGYIFANTHCLKHIYCKSQTPPVLTGPWWLRASAPIRPDDAALSAYNIYKEVTVHVPFGCKEVYANAPAWRDFNIVEDINTGIEPFTLTPSEAGQAYYNLQGQRITNPQRGQLVIVRYSDGTSRKMYVR